MEGRKEAGLGGVNRDSFFRHACFFTPAISRPDMVPFAVRVRVFECNYFRWFYVFEFIQRHTYLPYSS